MDETSIAGSRFSSEEGTVKHFSTGRVCSHDSCGTRLSIYNDGDFCAAHEPMTTMRTRGVKIA
ncbi:MAG: hypothetical protein GEV08_08435 [Acidimicrobiia bacterium]|nr:hypothetical protein [Acidimicrobiia bacterium]